MATHSRILAWEIPWTEELGGLQFRGLQRDCLSSTVQSFLLWWLTDLKCLGLYLGALLCCTEPYVCFGANTYCFDCHSDEYCLKSRECYASFLLYSFSYWASLVAQKVKHLPAMQEAWVQSLGREDPLEKEMATHSSTFAWKIPWTEEPGGLHGIAKSWTWLSD